MEVWGDACLSCVVSLLTATATWEKYALQFEVGSAGGGGVDDDGGGRRMQWDASTM